MTDIEVLRVFTDTDGQYGNPLGVVLDGAAIPDPNERQQLATGLGYSETIFFDDLEAGRIQIFTPAVEIPFAGHPTVGASWVIARELGREPEILRTAGGEVATWTQNGLTWVRGPLASTPPWWHERLASSSEVDQLTGPLSPAQDATQLWAWQNEAAGLVRARVFARRYGVAEDEACGSCCMRLAAALGRRLTIQPRTWIDRPRSTRTARDGRDRRVRHQRWTGQPARAVVLATLCSAAKSILYQRITVVRAGGQGVISTAVAR